VHAQAEEEIFYPSVRNLRIGNAEQLVQDSTREHDNIKRLLGEIERLDPVSEEFDSKVGDLKRTIQHHVEDEEGKIFPMLERQWTADQLGEVGQRIHSRKNDLKRRLAA
jgi:hemerythrin superfamily protein